MQKNSPLERTLLSIIKGCVLLSLFVPLLVVDQLLFPFVFPRTVLFRILIEIGMVCWVLLAAQHAEYRVRWNSLLISIGAFILVMLISSLGGVNWHHSLWSSFERGEGVITWLHLFGWLILLLTTTRDAEEWMEIFKCMVISGYLQTLYALGEYFKFRFAVDTSGIRVSGAIGNPSFLAPYLMAVITCAALLMAKNRSKIWRIASAILIALDLFVIWQTQTRGAILGCAVGIVAVGFIMLWQKFKMKGAVLGASILILCAVSVFAVERFVDLKPLITRAPIIYRLLTTNSKDITTENRLIVWGAGLQGFLARPLFGWGWENFSEPFNIYFDPSLTRDIGSHPWYDRAHNTLIEIGVATGGIGLIVYLVQWYLTFTTIWQRKTTLTRTEKLILTWFFIGYFVQNLFVFDTLNSYMLWILFLAMIQCYQPQRSAEKKKTFKAASRAVLVPMLGIGLLMALYYINIRPVLANYYTVEASVRSKGNPAQALANFSNAFAFSPATEEEPRFILAQYTRDTINRIGITDATTPLIKFSIAELQKTIDAHPASIQTYLLLSEVYLAADRLDESYIQKAESTALEALARAPRRYQTYTLLGKIKSEEGDLPAAIQYLTQATQLNNAFAESYWNLAIAYILNHDQEHAAATLDTVEKLGFPVYDEENVKKLVSAYSDARDLNAIIAFMDEVLKRVPDNAQYQQLQASLKKIRDDALKNLKEQQP